MTLAQPEPVPAHKSPQLPVPLDLPGLGVVDGDPARPHRFKTVSIDLLQRSEVLGDGISQAGVSGLPAGEFHGRDEVGEPWH